MESGNCNLSVFSETRFSKKEAEFFRKNSASDETTKEVCQMTPSRILIMISFIAIFLISCSNSENKESISASGAIEAKEVDVSAQVAGQIVSLQVEEDDAVQKGQVIAEIDHTKLDIQLRQGQANLASAQARLAQAKLMTQLTSTQTQTQIQQAKALLEASFSRLAQAQIGEELQQTGTASQIQQAEATLAQAKERLNQAQELYTLTQAQSKSQVEQAEATLKVAMTRLSLAEKGAREQEVNVVENSVSQAKANFDNAKLNLERTQKLHAEGTISKQQFDLAQLQFDVVRAQYQSAQEQLSLIKEGARYEDKEAAKAQVEQAEAALQLAKSALIQNDVRAKDVEVARAAVKQAEATLALAKANALQNKLRKEDISAAQASVDQAKAALELSEANTAQSQIQEQNVLSTEMQVKSAQDAVELLQTQINDAKITTPTSGIVTTKVVEIGELVSPGMPIVVITNLDTVYLTIFVPETRLGKVKLEQDAQVSVDSFPGRTFNGKVTYISPEAEFTPKNIQTKEERVKLVYGVKIELDNPEKLLKPGMPADAVLKF
jgi:multidrug resistance efflux pump